MSNASHTRDYFKPCPHCKNASNIKLVEYRPNCSGAVVCGQCGARGPKAKNDHKRGWKEKAAAAWNARAAVTDEQFTMAVHDGEAWQKVRTCQMVDLENVRWDDYAPVANGARRCSSCGKLFIRNGDVPRPNYCPNCGAKVVG